MPIGGFVKLYGEDEAGSGKVGGGIKQSGNPADEKRAFFARSVWQRAAVVGAGVVMNALLAIAIFYIYLFIANFAVELPLLNKHVFFGVNQVNTTDIIVTAVAKNSPAEKAGIKPFSKVLAINGMPVKKTSDFLEIINKNKGKEVTVTWQEVKTDRQHSAKMVPRVSPPKKEGALGVGFYSTTTAHLFYVTTSEKVLSGIIHPLNLLSYNFDVIGDRIKSSFAQKSAAPLSDAVSGPVGIYSIVGIIIQIPDLKERVLQVLNLAGILSISLAFFNVLPIPALDGGRLFFILIEGVTRKKVSPKIEGYAHAVGMAVLLALILLITFKDISQLIFR